MACKSFRLSIHTSVLLAHLANNPCGISRSAAPRFSHPTKPEKVARQPGGDRVSKSFRLSKPSAVLIPHLDNKHRLINRLPSPRFRPEKTRKGRPTAPCEDIVSKSFRLSTPSPVLLKRLAINPCGINRSPSPHRGGPTKPGMVARRLARGKKSVAIKSFEFIMPWLLWLTSRNLIIVESIAWPRRLSVALDEPRKSRAEPFHTHLSSRVAARRVDEN